MESASGQCAIWLRGLDFPKSAGYRYRESFTGQPVDPSLRLCACGRKNGNAHSITTFGRRHCRFRRWSRGARGHPRQVARPRGRDTEAAPSHKRVAASSRQLGRSGVRAQLQPVRPGAPSSSFVRGGMYEPLVVVTPAGGGREYKWLAQRLFVERERRTLSLNIRRASAGPTAGRSPLPTSSTA